MRQLSRAVSKFGRVRFAAVGASDPNLFDREDDGESHELSRSLSVQMRSFANLDTVKLVT